MSYILYILYIYIVCYIYCAVYQFENAFVGFRKCFDILQNVIQCNTHFRRTS